MTWEEARAYVESTIEETCRRSGISVEIRDPNLIALSVQYLRIGKRNVERGNNNAVLAKVAA